MADAEDYGQLPLLLLAGFRRAARCPVHKLFVVIASKIMALS